MLCQCRGTPATQRLSIIVTYLQTAKSIVWKLSPSSMQAKLKYWKDTINQRTIQPTLFPNAGHNRPEGLKYTPA